jgi:RNA polymerase sigma-70 factor, ECF subfamily
MGVGSEAADPGRRSALPAARSAGDPARPTADQARATADEERYAGLYRRHVRVVYNYAWRRVGDQAPDIVSETFLVAWRKMPRLPDDEELPWLLGVARRVVANAVRARARDVRLDRQLRAALAAGVGVVEPDHASSICAGDEVLTCMAKLNPRDQEALALVGWEGLDVRDAARVVGCSSTAFGVRLHRARRRLAQLLDAATDALVSDHTVASARLDRSGEST